MNKREEEVNDTEIIKYDPELQDQRLHPDKGKFLLSRLKPKGALRGRRNQ